MVAIDVGGAVEPSPAGLLAIVSYHLWLIAAFRVGGPVGNAMARTFARLVGAPDAARVATATSCYPYYHWWKRRLDKSQEQIKALVPEVPVLFLYGTAGYKSYLVREIKDYLLLLFSEEGKGCSRVGFPSPCDPLRVCTGALCGWSFYILRWRNKHGAFHVSPPLYGDRTVVHRPPADRRQLFIIYCVYFARICHHYCL